MSYQESSPVTFEVNEDGIPTLNVPYLFDTLDEALYGGPTGYNGLMRTSRSGTKPAGASDKCFPFQATLRFSGITSTMPSFSGNDMEIFSWELDPEEAEVPIEQHPQIEDIKRYYGGKTNPATQRIQFPETYTTYSVKKGTARPFLGKRPKSANQSLNPMFGRETFYVTGLIARTHHLVYHIPADLYKDVDTIIKTPPIPDISNFDWGTQDWLVRWPRLSSEGKNMTRISREYKLSAPGGWPSILHSGKW
jgi:hypothetical protein